jgi:V8-like Glu-specific endopeptidase
MAVFGSDDRVALQSATEEAPLAAFMQVAALFPDDVVTQSSGAMISPSSLLTAAHAIYSAEHGGWATQVQVIPGRLEGFKPFGVHEAIRLSTPSEWRVTGVLSYDLLAFDYGVVTLGSEIGYVTGWFDYGYVEDSLSFLGQELLNIGYPADKGGNTLYFDSGTVDRIEGDILYFNDDLDIMPGQSGSPVIYNNNGSDVILGVVSHQLISPVENGVLALSKTSTDNIQIWASQNNTTATLIDLNPVYRQTDIQLVTQVVRLVELIYNQQPGHTLLTDFKQQSAELGIARFADALVAGETTLDTNDVLVATVTVNAGITGDASQIAVDYLIRQLAALPVARGEVILNAATLFSTLTADAVFGEFATVYNAEVAVSVAYSVSPANADFRTVETAPVQAWLSSVASAQGSVTLVGAMEAMPEWG